MYVYFSNWMWIKLETLPTLLENEIDEESFKILKEEVVREIIVKAGPFFKFMHRWNSEFNSLNDIVTLLIFIKEIFPCNFISK